MSQRSEKLTRRLERMDERIDSLARLRLGDYQYHDQQLSDRADTERTLRKHSTDRLHKEMKALRLMDVGHSIAICLLAISMLLLIFTSRTGGAEVRATVGADDPVRRVQTIKALETQAAPPAEPPLNTLENARITYYCPCARCCGKSDGITSTGVQAQAGVTVSTDPAVIPTGSRVKIGDSWYIAQDTGVSGAAVDVFVEGHQEALELGVRTATVYWDMPDDINFTKGE